MDAENTKPSFFRGKINDSSLCVRGTHNVLLGADDPILVTVTLNERVLKRYVEIFPAQNGRHVKALSAVLAEQVEQSKAVSGLIITEAANYVGRQVREATTDALTEVGSKIKAELDTATTARQLMLT